MIYQVAFKTGQKVPVQAEKVEYGSENFDGVQKPVMRLYIPDATAPDDRSKAETVAVFLADNIAGYVRDWATHTGPATPADPSLPSAPATNPYKLIFTSPKQDGKYWEVIKTEPWRDTLGDGSKDSPLYMFLGWCQPFYPEQWNNTEPPKLCASDENPQNGIMNWWVNLPYRLPELDTQWLVQLEDEHWWVYHVTPKF